MHNAIGMYAAYHLHSIDALAVTGISHLIGVTHLFWEACVTGTTSLKEAGGAIVIHVSMTAWIWGRWWAARMAV